MMVKKCQCARVLIAFFLLFAMDTAVACDAKLSDVKATDYSQQTDVVRQLYAFNLARQTYEESQSKSKVGVSYGPVGINGSKEDHRRFAESVNKSVYADTFLEHSSEILKSYGDPTLLAAYLACLAADGGIHISLVDRGPKEAVLRITYYRAPGGPVTATVSSVTDVDKIPGVSLVTDGGCLHKGATLDASNPCISTLRFDSSTTPLLFAINTSAGGNEAYIPPRIRLVEESRPIPDDYVDGAHQKVDVITTESKNGDIVENTGCTAPLPEGFSLDPNVQVNASCDPHYSCTLVRGDILSQTPDKACARLSCGEAGGKYTVCKATLSGRMTALRWEPQ